MDKNCSASLQDIVLSSDLSSKDSETQVAVQDDVAQNGKVYSKRKDVVFKTLLRKCRKFLQKSFNSNTKYLQKKRFKAKSFYREKIVEFASEELGIPSPSEIQIQTLATFLYPQDALKGIEHFQNAQQIKSWGQDTKDLLYRYSHEKLRSIMDKDGMLQMFQYFSRSQGPDLNQDFTKALDIILSGQTI